MQVNEDTENHIYSCTQNACSYVGSEYPDRSVLVNAINEGDDESVFADRDAMLDLVERAAASLTFE